MGSRLTLKINYSYFSMPRKVIHYVNLNYKYYKYKFFYSHKNYSMEKKKKCTNYYISWCELARVE